MLSLLASAGSLAAQHVLIGEDGGKPIIIQTVHHGRPMFEKDGKLTRAATSRFGLHKVDEYAPYYISVRNMKLVSSHLETIDSGHELNRRVQFRADFESPFRLDDVFLVLDLNSANVGKALFIWEIGTLFPRDEKSVSISVPVSDTLGQGKFKLHLFAGGREVFHSNIPFTAIDQALNRMVARRIKDVTDAAPRPFVGPAPEYPAALRKAKLKGDATIHFTLAPNGRVLNPKVKSASDPAFGEAALVAARQWRFLPKVVGGRPTSVPVDMPFVFTPKQ